MLKLLHLALIAAQKAALSHAVSEVRFPRPQRYEHLKREKTRMASTHFKL
jgi:hypothetical protein